MITYCKEYITYKFSSLTLLKISKKDVMILAYVFTNMINCIISENFIVIFDSSCFRLMRTQRLLNLLHSLGFQ